MGSTAPLDRRPCATPMGRGGRSVFDHCRCLRIATISNSRDTFLMYWVHGFWPFFFIAAALALFRAPLQPLMDAVALDFVEARGRLSYGMFLIWASIASGVGTAGAGFLIAGHATRTAFLWGAVALLAGVLSGAAGKSVVPKHTIEKVTFKDFGSIARNLPLLAFLFIVFLVFFCSTTFWNFNGVYFADLGGSSTLFGMAVAIDSAGEIPFFFLAAPIFKRFGLQKTLLFTFACSTLRLFAYAFISNPRVAVWLESQQWHLMDALLGGDGGVPQATGETGVAGYGAVSAVCLLLWGRNHPRNRLEWLRAGLLQTSLSQPLGNASGAKTFFCQRTAFCRRDPGEHFLFPECQAARAGCSRRRGGRGRLKKDSTHPSRRAIREGLRTSS